MQCLCHSGVVLDWKQHSMETRPPSHPRVSPQADRLTGIALLASVLVALGLGLWLWPSPGTGWTERALGLDAGEARPLDGSHPGVQVRPDVGPPTITPPARPTPRRLLVAAAAAPSVARTASAPAWRGRAVQDAGLSAAPGAAPTLGQLPAGALVLVLEQQAAPDGQPWYRVRRPGGPEGWAPAALIDHWIAPSRQATPLPPETPGPLGTRAVVDVANAPGVQLRAGADAAASPRAWLPNGASVLALEFAVDRDGRAWARVEGDGVEGWAPVSALR